MQRKATRVLSLVPYNIFPAKVGGQKGIALFNAYFANEVNLHCITVKSNHPSFATNYSIYNVIPEKVWRYINPFLFFTISKLIKEKRITHFLIEHPYYGWLGLLVKWFCGVKLIVHSHNIESTRWKSLNKWWWKLMYWYEGAIHRGADYNFFITEDDRQFAITYYKVAAQKSITATYGIDIKETPHAEDKNKCRQWILTKHQIDPGNILFLFNGALDYQPNIDGVKNIIENINPLLLTTSLKYRIIICGRGLPEEFQSLQAYESQHIIYAGFVDDISVYFKGADVFINPITDGGGIKTKLVEAIGYGTPAISTQSGAMGVTFPIAGNMLQVVTDHDWPSFAGAMGAASESTGTGTTFYNHFYWGNIAATAAQFISNAHE